MQLRAELQKRTSDPAACKFNEEKDEKQRQLLAELRDCRERTLSNKPFD